MMSAETNAVGPYGAFVDLGRRKALCRSPELFFLAFGPKDSCAPVNLEGTVNRGAGCTQGWGSAKTGCVPSEKIRPKP